VNLIYGLKNVLTRTFLEIILILLLILPGIFLGFCILTYGVNVPYLDQWAIARILLKVSDGTINFQDLIAPYFEHRMFFPRLIIIALAFLSNWNVKDEMLVSFGLAALISINLFRYSGISINSQPEANHSSNISNHLDLLIGLGILTNLLIFSPIQWENWLMGMYFKYFMPIAAISSAILICSSRIKTLLKVFYCTILSTFATFSIANGMICWLVLFPVLFPTRQEILAQIKAVWVWIICFLLCLGFYLYNYKSPIKEFSPFFVVTHPIEALNFLVALLGTPLAFGSVFSPVLLSSVLGSIIFALLFAISIYIYQSGEMLWRRSIGWLAIAAYAILSDAIIVLGRVYFGIEQANTSRYTTFSIYAIVALIYLIAIVAREIYSEKINMEREQRSRQIPFSYPNNYLNQSLCVLLAIFLFSYTQTFSFSLNKMAEVRTSRLQGKACLLGIKILVEEDCLKQHINPKLSVVKERVERLNDLGFLQPPLIKSPVLLNYRN